MQLISEQNMNRSFVIRFLTRHEFRQLDTRGRVWQRSVDGALATVESYTKRFPTVRIYSPSQPLRGEPSKPNRRLAGDHR